MSQNDRAIPDRPARPARPVRGAYDFGAVGRSQVVNYALPNEPESDVHRTGRTGRAGLSGIALSFCDIGERPYLPAIEQLLRRHLKVVEDHPHRSGLRPGSPTDLEPRKPRAPRPFMISVEELFGGSRREGFAG